MDEFDRRLLNRLQHGLPLEPHPYALLAAELDCREEDILRRLDDLLDDGTLTRFGPLFDIEPLGGAFTLAAMSGARERAGGTRPAQGGDLPCRPAFPPLTPCSPAA